MRKRPAIAYPFHPAPRELDARWMQRSFFERALGGELFRVSGGRPMPCGDDWRETLCRVLAISGKERPNVKKALQSLADKNLVEVSGDGSVTVHFAPPGDVQVAPSSPSGDAQVEVRSPSGGSQVESRSTSGDTQVEPRFDSSPRDDSSYRPEKEKKREEKKREREKSACVREIFGPATEPPRGPSCALSAGAVSTRFRALYLAARKLDPAMGGTNVGWFHERLATTAAARGKDPIAMLESAFGEWAAGGFQGSDRASPYSAFVARFEQLVDPAGKPQGEADTLRAQASAALDAGNGDKARRLLNQAKAVEARHARG